MSASILSGGSSGRPGGARVGPARSVEVSRGGGGGSAAQMHASPVAVGWSPSAWRGRAAAFPGPDLADAHADHPLRPASSFGVGA